MHSPNHWRLVSTRGVPNAVLMSAETASKSYAVQGTLSRAKLRNCSTNLVLLPNRWGKNKPVVSHNELTEQRNTVPWAPYCLAPLEGGVGCWTPPTHNPENPPYVPPPVELAAH